MSQETAMTRADTARSNGSDELPAHLSAATLEQVLQGDLSKLTAKQRVEVYLARCAAAGLDPRTKPFDYLSLSGKLVLYANATAAQQAAEKRGLNLQIMDRQRMDDIYLVTCRVTDPSGRMTESIGAVTLGNKKGDELCNAVMKAETKAKRRGVLSFCGLGMLDETEIETIPGAVRVLVDAATGEVLNPVPAPPAPATPKPTAAPPNSPGRQRATTALKESEKVPSYAGQAGAGEPLTVPELKKRVTALLEELEGPVPSQAIPLFAACIDRKFKQFSELTQGDWQRLAMALTSAVDHRKRALRHWDEFCVLVGADPMDHDARNSDWKDLVGSHLTDLGSYTPDTWAVLANHLDRLIVAHRDAPQGGTTDTEIDPFEGE